MKQVYWSRYNKPPLVARCCHVASDFTNSQATNEQTDEQTNRTTASSLKAIAFASVIPLFYYYYYNTCIYNARTFSSGTELEALVVTRWAAWDVDEVLMVYLKRWVFRRRLKVPKAGEILILRGRPSAFQITIVSLCIWPTLVILVYSTPDYGGL